MFQRLNVTGGGVLWYLLVECVSRCCHFGLLNSKKVFKKSSFLNCEASIFLLHQRSCWSKSQILYKTLWIINNPKCCCQQVEWDITISQSSLCSTSIWSTLQKHLTVRWILLWKEGYNAAEQEHRCSESAIHLWQEEKQLLNWDFLHFLECKDSIWQAFQ